MKLGLKFVITASLACLVTGFLLGLIVDRFDSTVEEDQAPDSGTGAVAPVSDVGAETHQLATGELTDADPGTAADPKVDPEGLDKASTIPMFGPAASGSEVEREDEAAAPPASDKVTSLAGKDTKALDRTGGAPNAPVASQDQEGVDSDSAAAANQATDQLPTIDSKLDPAAKVAAANPPSEPAKATGEATPPMDPAKTAAVAVPAVVVPLAPKLDPRFAELAGKRIWMSECAGTKEGLTSWNGGEAFASLGIGHFLWFPVGKEFEYDESFPTFLAYYGELPETQVHMPEWLQAAIDCPWPDRATFLAARADEQMVQLREFLFATVSEQTQFIYQRLLDSKGKLLATVEPEKHPHVSGRFDALAATNEGSFAMMDYVNFKGEGVKPSERYNDQGWGLLQAMEEMKPGLEGFEAVKDFAAATDFVLRRRVTNHPVDERWMKGWASRVRKYAQALGLPEQVTVEPKDPAPAEGTEKTQAQPVQAEGVKEGSEKGEGQQAVPPAVPVAQ